MLQQRVEALLQAEAILREQVGWDKTKTLKRRITQMHISKLDMKALTVFSTIMRTRSLSAAADQLELSQPAVSQTVARLRKHFGDVLFARTAQGMRPTQRALELSEPVEEILFILRNKLESKMRFDPSQAQRSFSFLGTDFGVTVFLTRLTQEVRKRAPSSKVRAMPALPLVMKSQLESGEVDLAVGAFSELVAGFHQKALYVDSFVCIAGAQYRGAAGSLSKKEYTQASHALVSPLPGGYESVEKLLRSEVEPARIVLEVPSFMGLLFQLRESDLLCTVPRRVGIGLAELAGLRVYPVPFELPGLDVRQYWHQRVHNDPAHQWFRNLFNELFAQP